VVMGWTDSHLHEFTIGGQRFGQPSRESPGYYVIPERSVRLDHVIYPSNTRFEYLYDFGDGWQHEVRVEKMLAAEPGVHYPRCLTGARACPPEDCGATRDTWSCSRQSATRVTSGTRSCSSGSEAASMPMPSTSTPSTAG
jgi:hypothetical protein